jgi:hypothetical protein
VKITKEQASMLADLAGTIQEKYDLLIGYSNPAIPVIQQREIDFIIYENDDSDTLRCFHKDDVTLQPMGPYLCRVVPEFPEHDDKVQDLFDRLNHDLLDGVISFDPGVTRTEGNITVQVTKKRFPGIDEDLFDTNIPSNIGTVYPYRLIVIHAEHNPRFALAKKVIDEFWPQSKNEDEGMADEVKKQLQPRPISLFDLIRKFFT